MGMLAVGLAIYTVASKSQKISHAVTRPTLLSHFLLGLSSAILVMSDFLSVQLGAQLALVGVLLFGSSSLLGFKAVSYLIFPLLYVLFSIPIWNYLNPALQSLTTFVSTTAIEISSIPAYISGNTIILPYGALQIANGCSGLRYLLVTSILSLHFSQQRPNKAYVALIVFLTAAAFSLLANWIRVTLLIIIAEQTDMQSSLVTDHEMFGWIVYIVTMIPCVWLLLIIEKIAPAKEKKIEHSSEGRRSEVNTPRLPISYVIIAAMISAAPNVALSILEKSRSSHFTVTPKLDDLNLPQEWHLSENSASEFPHGFVGYSEQLNVEATDSLTNNKLAITVVNYEQEKQGAELVNENNKLVTSPWTKSHQETITGKTKASLAYLINNRREKAVTLWYFRVHDSRTSNRFMTKVASLRSILEPNAPKAMVKISIKCETDCQRERNTLAQLNQDYVPY